MVGDRIRNLLGLSKVNGIWENGAEKLYVKSITAERKNMASSGFILSINSYRHQLLLRC